MLWKLHKAQPGDGARLGPLWEPWLGLRHDTAMDAGAMVDTCELLELVLWPQSRQTGEVSGMLLASPSTSPDAGIPTSPGMRGAPAGGILAA